MSYATKWQTLLQKIIGCFITAHIHKDFKIFTGIIDKASIHHGKIIVLHCGKHYIAFPITTPVAVDAKTQNIIYKFQDDIGIISEQEYPTIKIKENNET